MNQRSDGYLWAEVGAIAGTIVAGVPAAFFFAVAILNVLFEDVSDLYLASLLAAAFGFTFAGAALGCWLALRRHELPGAGRTGLCFQKVIYSTSAVVE